MTDAAAIVHLCGNQVLDMLIASASDDPRLPMALLGDPELIPDHIARAALAVAVHRLEDK